MDQQREVVFLVLGHRESISSSSLPQNTPEKSYLGKINYEISQLDEFPLKKALQEILAIASTDV